MNFVSSGIDKNIEGFFALLFRVDQLELCLRAHREKHQILQVRLAAPIKVHVDQELKDFTTFDSSYKVYSILTLLRAKKKPRSFDSIVDMLLSAL
jgi:hypothetical protein